MLASSSCMMRRMPDMKRGKLLVRFGSSHISSAAQSIHAWPSRTCVSGKHGEAQPSPVRTEFNGNAESWPVIGRPAPFCGSQALPPEYMLAVTRHQLLQTHKSPKRPLRIARFQGDRQTHGFRVLCITSSMITGTSSASATIASGSTTASAAAVIGSRSKSRTACAARAKRNMQMRKWVPKRSVPKGSSSTSLTLEQLCEVSSTVVSVSPLCNHNWPGMLLLRGNKRHVLETQANAAMH